MKTFVSDYKSQLRAPAHILTNLFRFDFTHTYRFTSFGQDIFYSTYWWKARDIRFDAAKLNITPKADSIGLQIVNVNKWFSNLCLAESVSGCPVYIYQAALEEKSLDVLGSDLMFFGYADKRSFNQLTGRLTVKNHMAHWRRLVPEYHTPTCRWVFKDAASQVIGTDTLNYTCIIDHPATAANRPITGAQYASFWAQTGSAGVAWALGSDYKEGTCRYAGAGASCDQSWEQCAIYSNTLNFGGNRWLPYYEDKVIWWGRVPRRDEP